MRVSCLLFVLFAAVVLSFPLQKNRSYHGYSLMRVTPSTQSQLQYLLKVNSNSSIGIDFWLRTTAVNHSADVMVSLSAKKMFCESLKNRNVKYEFLIQDIGKVLQEDIRGPPLDWKRLGPIAFFAQYNRFSEILYFTSFLANNYPNIVSMIEIGKSYEGRPLRLLRVSTSADRSKPAIWIQGGAHARELIGPAVVSYLALQLITRFFQDSAVSQIVDKFDWYILPLVNPDGYEYALTKDRLWRKTRSFNPSEPDCYGVDANRNWDFHWNDAAGASRDACSHNYAGPKAFSEPETSAISSFILTYLKNRLLLFLDFHSYSQRWLTPWGYTSELPPNYQSQKTLAEVTMQALASVFGTQYRTGSSGSTLYTVSGGARDWAYGAAGAEYSYVVELRDKGNFGFVLPKAQILPCAVETWAGLKAMACELVNRKSLVLQNFTDVRPQSSTLVKVPVQKEDVSIGIAVYLGD